MSSIAASRVSACPSATTISVLSPAAKHDARLQHRARIEPGPDRLLEFVPAGESRRPLGPTVAAEELGAVGGPRRLPPAHVQEGDASAELGIPWVRRQHRLRRRFGFGDDPRALAPREVPSTHSAYAVSDRRRGRPDRFATVSTDSFTGSVRLDELDQIELDAAVEVLEAAVPGPMARDVRRFRASNRLRGRAPDSPLSSSRTYSASPGGSLTGSFDHGVSWFSRLLPAQV